MVSNEKSTQPNFFYVIKYQKISPPEKYNPAFLAYAAQIFVCSVFRIVPSVWQVFCGCAKIILAKNAAQTNVRTALFLKVEPQKAAF